MSHRADVVVDRSPAHGRQAVQRARHASTDHHLADLHYRRKIGVVGDIGQDLIGMRPEAGAEGLHRLAEDMAHADEGGGLPGSPPLMPLSTV